MIDRKFEDIIELEKFFDDLKSLPYTRLKEGKTYLMYESVAYGYDDCHLFIYRVELCSLPEDTETQVKFIALETVNNVGKGDNIYLFVEEYKDYWVCRHVV